MSENDMTANFMKILEGWIDDSKVDKKELNTSLQAVREEMIAVKIAIDSFKEDKVTCKDTMNAFNNRIMLLEKTSIVKDECIKHEAEIKKDLKELKDENVTNERVGKIETKVEWLVKNYYKATGIAIILLFILNKS